LNSHRNEALNDERIHDPVPLVQRGMGCCGLRVTVCLTNKDCNAREEYFWVHPPTSIKQTQSEIEALTGISSVFGGLCGGFSFMRQTNESDLISQEVCQLLPTYHPLSRQGTLPALCLSDPAAHLRIELCFLPAYAPHLIERLWKCVPKQCLSSHFYPDFGAFKSAISTCLAQPHSTHKTALGSLLTLRFQLFSNAHFVPA
jgi:hypothetical protein